MMDDNNGKNTSPPCTLVSVYENGANIALMPKPPLETSLSQMSNSTTSNSSNMNHNRYDAEIYIK